MLLTDDRKYLEKKLTKLSVKFNSKASIDSLKDWLEVTEKKMISVAIHETEVSLKNYKEFEDVIEVFDKIVTRSFTAAESI